MRSIIKESVLRNAKNSFLQRRTLLLVPLLVFQICTAEAAPAAFGLASPAKQDPYCKVGPEPNGPRHGGPTMHPDHKDTTPAAFDFATQTRVAPDTQIESEFVTISGINHPAHLSITGGEYSINGHPYRHSPGIIKNNQRVRIKVRSSAESLGKVSATLRIGRVSGTFTVKTINLTGRVEAEAADQYGGASTVPDNAASNDQAVFIGAAGFGISTADSVNAQTLIVAYRTDTAGTLEATINGSLAGKFSLRPTGGAYATSSVIANINAGDVVVISTPSTAGSSETYIDHVDFAVSPFRAVSTVATAADPWASDGVAVASTGDIYVSNGASISRVTPDGDVSIFASGFASTNGSRFDSKGNLFVAEYQGNAVRKITPEGVVTTFASGLNGPAGVWLDKDDNVFVSLFGAGFSGTGATVLKITPDGSVSTYATAGGLQDVVSIVGDENGNVYAANWASGTFFNITGGNVSVLAETGGASNHVCYSHGYIYIPSPSSALVRRLSLEGTVETFIGTETRQVIDGPIASADFQRPNSCAISADGTIMYVMGSEQGLLRKVDAGAP